MGGGSPWGCTTWISRRRGFTLLELIFVCGVFAIFTMMVAHALVIAYRAHVQTRDKVHASRQALLTLDRLSREFRTCRQLVAPPPASGTWMVPTPSDPLVFRRNSAAGTVEVRYWYDGPKRQVRRFEPGDPDSGRLLAEAVETFRVRPVIAEEVVHAEIQVASRQYSVEARALEL